MPFACSICEQESTKICAFCTKDSCDNHLCPRCGFCSDCCECEVPLDEVNSHPHHIPLVEAEHAGTPDHAASAEPAPPEPPTSPEATAQPETSLPALDEPSAELPETPDV